MSYKEKYRAKAIEYKESGHTFEELKEVFAISASTYYRWKRIQNTTGCYVSQPTEKRTRRRKIDPEELKTALKNKPDAYLREWAEMFHCSTVAIHKKLKSLNITYKKRRLPIPKNRRKTARNISNDSKRFRSRNGFTSTKAA
ncbi:MAG: IS630 transposase-related protein [Planctomycetia bacterium]|nr:IS630 transposase-related protein [Planctomycetia bacterium]